MSDLDVALADAILPPLLDALRESMRPQLARAADRIIERADALDELLTGAELGERLGVTAETVRRWGRRGTLPPPVRYGQQDRWRWSAVIAHHRFRELPSKRRGRRR